MMASCPDAIKKPTFFALYGVCGVLPLYSVIFSHIFSLTGSVTWISLTFSSSQT